MLINSHKARFTCQSFFHNFASDNHFEMLKRIWGKILHVLRNKYLLSLSLFSIWIIFFDDNNLIIRSGMIRNANQLRDDCEYYEKRIITDSIKLNELKSSPEMLEKFAREQYLMKKDNEDIFIFVED